MIFSLSDFNNGRREGFNDTQGQNESYGTGTGSGAYDPANTGLGGYGGQRMGAQSQSQQFGTTGSTTTGTQGTGGFNPDYAASQSGDFNNSWDRTAERTAGFKGNDSSFAQTDTGRTFASGTPPTGGQSQQWNEPQSQQSQGGTGGVQSFRATNNLDEVNDQLDQTYSQGQSERARHGKTGADDGTWDAGNQTQERQGGKPGFGDKMRGNMEKLAGAVTGNQDMKARGQERKEGDLY